MKNIIKEIFKWNEIAGNKAKELDYSLERDMNYEEDYEFMQAVRFGDKKEMLDGWCDKIFVSTGTMMKAGFTEEELIAGLSEVISSNFSKFFKDENGNLKCIKNESGKIQKPESFRKPDFNFLEKGNGNNKCNTFIFCLNNNNFSSIFYKIFTRKKGKIRKTKGNSFRILGKTF